jgi:ferredoxin
MSNLYKISRTNWFSLLQTLSVSSYDIYAPVRKNGGIDYATIDEESIDEIVYNVAKPSTPLKVFFLPVKLNVTPPGKDQKKSIIIGAPACDVEGLRLLDLIYLDEKFADESYLSRRENSLIISTDCFITMDHCHCTTYGINPYPSKGSDISLSSIDDEIYLTPWSEKGEQFIGDLDSSGKVQMVEGGQMEAISLHRQQTITELSKKNELLPGIEKTGERIEMSGREVWEKYSSKCVSCGACSAICPTCSCFLLIDRPEFEKVKQLDTCQYPAFERVAGGEDPLRELTTRFKNRYMCKYIWKPKRFNAPACTGCGRCIEACIAKINKNELIMEIV